MGLPLSVFVPTSLISSNQDKIAKLVQRTSTTNPSWKTWESSRRSASYASKEEGVDNISQTLLLWFTAVRNCKKYFWVVVSSAVSVRLPELWRNNHRDCNKSNFGFPHCGKDILKKLVENSCSVSAFETIVSRAEHSRSCSWPLAGILAMKLSYKRLVQAAIQAPAGGVQAGKWTFTWSVLHLVAAEGKFKITTQVHNLLWSGILQQRKLDPSPFCDNSLGKIGLIFCEPRRVTPATTVGSLV